MLNFDYIAKMAGLIKELTPKPRVDYVLATRCPIGTDEGIQVNYKEKSYFIFHWTIIEKVKKHCARMEAESPSPKMPTAAALLYGLPIVENEELVREILATIHLTSKEYKLSKEAHEWVFNYKGKGE